MDADHPFQAPGGADRASVDQDDLLRRMRPWLVGAAGIALLAGLASGAFTSLLGIGGLGAWREASPLTDRENHMALISMSFFLSLSGGLTGFCLWVGYLLVRQILAIGSVCSGGGAEAMAALLGYQLRLWQTLGIGGALSVVAICGGVPLLDLYVQLLGL